MVEVSCNICGSNERTILIKTPFDLVRCERCGLVYVTPRPAEEELAGLYSFDRYHIAQRDEKRQRKDLRKFERRMRIIMSYRPDRGRILDVGCSTGLFLRKAEEYGWRAYGIDISEDAARYARENYGLNVIGGKIETSDFKPGFFDVITFFDSLEHMADPLRALRRARELLKEGGLIVITTPDISGLLPMATYLILAKRFGIWHHPSPPAHLYEFSKVTVRKLLKKAGFKTIYISSEQIPMGYSVGKLETALITIIKACLSGEPASHVERPGDRSLPNSVSASGPTNISRKAARLAVRGGSYAIVALAHLISHILGRGDSMLVMARKTGLEGT